MTPARVPGPRAFPVQILYAATSGPGLIVAVKCKNNFRQGSRNASGHDLQPKSNSWAERERSERWSDEEYICIIKRPLDNFAADFIFLEQEQEPAHKNLPSRL